MTHEVLWSDEAFGALQAHLVDDREGLLLVFEAVDRLAVDPRPADARPWGGALFRLRVGPYRVIYRIVEERVLIQVLHLGRRSGGDSQG